MSDTQNLELMAMEEVGRLRTRAIGGSFVVSWAVLAALMLSIGIGLLPALLVGAGLAAGISRTYVSVRSTDYVAAAAKKFGVSPDSIATDKYIIH